MTNLEKRKKRICKEFCKQHNKWLEIDYDRLVAGEYGLTMIFKDQNEMRVEISANDSIDGRTFFFWFTPPTEKKQGRQPVSDELERRVDISLRLPRWVKNGLSEITEGPQENRTMTALIERAVIDQYGLEKKN